jgi:hypothetical protein
MHAYGGANESIIGGKKIGAKLLRETEYCPRDSNF